MAERKEITDLIPHRPPFLLVDRIVSCSENTIITEKTFPGEMDVFQGHYPENPITPGVILCEAIFQSGALLMATLLQDNAEENSVPVLTRIQGARFKRSVLPDEKTEITVVHKETVSSVAFFKGTMRLAGKVAVQVEFSCSLVPKHM